MQMLGVSLVAFVTLWCASVMANPEIRIRPDLGAVTPAQRLAIGEATKVMREFMATFNAQDSDGWSKTLLFPHVRISSGGVVVHPSRQEFAAQMDFQAFERRFNWHRSAWDSLEVFQVSPNKVHIAVQFTRYDVQQQALASFDSLYILQPGEGGKWGIRARSSFAP